MSFEVGFVSTNFSIKSFIVNILSGIVAPSIDIPDRMLGYLWASGIEALGVISSIYLFL
jgi:hypothetical protein